MARKMRDSGVEWIGEVPEGWEVRKAKSIIIANDGGKRNIMPLVQRKTRQFIFFIRA